MKISNIFVRTMFYNRLRAIDRMRNKACEVQHDQFTGLMAASENCEYLNHYGVGMLSDYDHFRSHVPVVSYEELSPWIERVMAGEQGVLSNDPTRWLARSSGTTNDRSKFIPINSVSLKNCHYRGGRDVMAVFADNHPHSNAFAGKALTLGGSQQVVQHTPSLKTGDLSAILIDNAPRWISAIREPRPEVALIDDFNQKVQKICETCSAANVTSFAGVPSWNLRMMNHIIEYNGKSNLLEVWPNMSLFIHGGMNFEPYKEAYKSIIPSTEMAYMETYNASEGFFAMQDDPAHDDMLLMLDYGTFYEFLSMDNIDDTSNTIPLQDVKIDVNYAMIITTAGGLWRYMIGDTVKFTSVNPYKIKITGRTKHFINAFGEELIVDNAEKAITIACKKHNAKVREYTAAPIFMKTSSQGAHQWVVEFEQIPENLEAFKNTLDTQLQQCNSDYAAKRKNNATMSMLKLTAVPKETFYQWLLQKGKVGGQNKVPRLSNSRDYVEALLKIAEPITQQKNKSITPQKSKSITQTAKNSRQAAK